MVGSVDGIGGESDQEIVPAVHIRLMDYWRVSISVGKTPADARVLVQTPTTRIGLSVLLGSHLEEHMVKSYT